MSRASPTSPPLPGPGWPGPTSPPATFQPPPNWSILDHLDGGSLDGTEQPFRVYLTCIQVLGALGDQRAPTLLGHAVDDLLRRADALDAGERAHYLADVDWRADLLQLAGVRV